MHFSLKIEEEKIDVRQPPRAPTIQYVCCKQSEKLRPFVITRNCVYAETEFYHIF